MHLPYYSNVIEGLPNRFRHWNVRVDLLHLGQDPVKGDLGTSPEGSDGFYSSSVSSDDDVVSGFSFASEHSSSMQDDCGVLKGSSGKQDTGVTAPTMVSPESEESPSGDFGMSVHPCGQELPAASLVDSEVHVDGVVVDPIPATVVIDYSSISGDGDAFVLSPSMEGFTSGLRNDHVLDRVETVQGVSHMGSTSLSWPPRPDSVVVDAVHGRLWPRKRGRQDVLLRSCSTVSSFSHAFRMTDWCFKRRKLKTQMRKA